MRRGWANHAWIDFINTPNYGDKKPRLKNSSEMLRIALIYDSGKRYVFDFDLAIKVLKLKEADIKKLEVAVKKEIAQL